MGLLTEEKFSLWPDLRKAIRGSDTDYTKINLNRAIFLLSVPMVLELVMESTFALVDIFFIGSLGSSAVATVGLTETYLFLLYSIAIGLSMAVTAIIARRIGEKKPERAAISATQSIFIALIVSIPFTIGGIYFSKELLTLMGADEWALSHGYVYTQWMLGGNAVIILLFVINAVFRGAGDAAIAMKVLGIANGCNIILDPLLIFGWGPFPSMGIEGAAIATNLGRGTAVLVQFYFLFKGSKIIAISLSHFRFNTAAMWNIIKTSLGGVGQMIVAMSSWIFLMRILADVGSNAVAGSTIAMRIMMFTLMPAWGFANAAATLVGQNLGASNPQRAESSVWKIGIYNTYFLLGVAVVFFVFNQNLVSIFTNDPSVIAIGGEWLRIVSYSFIIYGWWMVCTQAFNGAGDTRTPTYINIVFFWMLQIPLSYYLALGRNWQHSGVFWAIFISETLVGVFTLWLFTRGKWKTVKV